MPARVNLHESDLRCSTHINIKEKQAKASQADTKAHVTFGTRAKKLFGLFTLFSFVSNISLARHQISPNATLQIESSKDSMNSMSIMIVQLIKFSSLLSYVTNVSTNEVFTFTQTMKEDDRMDFVSTTEKVVQF